MQVIYKGLRTRLSEKDRETIATWRRRAIAFCHILIIVIAAFLVERPASGATSRTAFNAAGVALSVGRPTSALLSEIVTWLSENFGLAAIHDHPAIEYVPQTELARLRFQSLLKEGSSSDGIVTRYFVALYNHDTKTIFLSDEWTGAIPRNCRCWSMKWFITCRTSASSNMNALRPVKNSPTKRKTPG